MRLSQVLEKFKTAPDFAANVTHWSTKGATEGKYEDFPGDIDKRLVDTLKNTGIEKLYSHQAESFRAACGGHNFVVVTPTASGKTRMRCIALPRLC